jgi:hypothetical protein
MGLIRIADTRGNSSLDRRSKLLRDDFGLIHRDATFDFQRTTDNQFTLTSAYRDNLAQEFVIPFRVPDVPWVPVQQVENDWTQDITTTGINTTTFTGGLIDGLTKENRRTYLYWAFLDANLNFTGIGMTRKPFSTFSAISGGSAAKGATGKIFTTVNAYQFTEGSQVCVRNRVGTAPEYQWNWGVLQTVNSSTSITIDMNNSADYGSSITGTTSGEIFQWDKFRPWVVTSSGQTLYDTYYTLMGEIYLNETGLLKRVYKRDAEYRHIPLPTHEPSLVYPVHLSSGGPVSTTAVAIGRKAPLWAEAMRFRLSLSGTSAGNLIICFSEGFGGADSSNAICRLQVDNRSNDIEVPNWPLYRNAVTYWTSTNTGGKVLQLQGWYIHGGMRL